MENLNYSGLYEGEAGWIVEEKEFDSRYLGKCESIFTQGNGYIGIRNALEDRYVGEVRGMFVNGTFDKADESEVPELPNLPDITAADIYINGFRLSLESGDVQEYSRKMNYKTGETIRSFTWNCPTGESVYFEFRRFVSLCREHVVANKIKIKPLNGNIIAKIESGIDARVTNTGVQHFREPDSRIYANRYLQTISVSREKEIVTAVQATHKLSLNGESWDRDHQGMPYIRNRKNICIYEQKLESGDIWSIEKFSTIYTNRDKRYIDTEKTECRKKMSEEAMAELKEVTEIGYEKLFAESCLAWEDFWNIHDIKIKSQDIFDQLSVRFAIYHLHIMNNEDDNRLGIGAKGLSGEEYKGHSFWDTEIFLMPYYLLTSPRQARKLLEYRYYILKGAKEKAKAAGYKGAMYPWESAWIDDGEVCADIIGVDVETGRPMRVLCGEIEVHISADIAYAVWQYYEATKDQEFMEKYGYEMILETAKFWASRCTWSEEHSRYEILNVIGPDEYKEEVNNDVYTNYMACFNMKKALEILDTLSSNIRNQLSEKLDLLCLRGELEQVLQDFYLPVPGKDEIVPQNDTYLSLKEISLDKYKNGAPAGSIHQDYSMERLKEVQVSKQGDLVVLMYLLNGIFSEEIERKNYFYYEKHTTHDSSLSKCTHAILANDLGLPEESYKFYKEASQTDVGPNLKSCDNGIHSAACGGIWQCVVMGYGGVRIIDDELQIKPSLPQNWENLEFQMQWRGKRYKVHATQNHTDIVEQEIGL